MVYEQHGETLSSLLKKQHSQPGGCNTGGPLRFSKSIILWLQSDTTVLNTRLDERVDDMMSRGLVKEIVEFWETNNIKSLLGEKNEKYGVFQSLGLKEFQEYLLLSEEERNSEKGKKSLEKGVELLKLCTRQYAKQQVKWIKNRFLRNGQRQAPPIYGLDVTDISKWTENVSNLAEDIIRSHLKGEKPSVEPLPVENTKEVIDKIYECECGLLLTGKTQYEVHLKSRNHNRRIKRLNKLKDSTTSIQEVTEVKVQS